MLKWGKTSHLAIDKNETAVSCFQTIEKMKEINQYINIKAMRLKAVGFFSYNLIFVRDQ